VFLRHRRHGEATRAAVRAWGLEIVCENPDEYSDTVTAVFMPPGHDADQLRKLILESFDGKIQMSGSLDAGHPYGGKTRQASFVLPRNSDGTKLRIRAEIETKSGKRRRVNWATAQPPDSDGWISFQLLRRDDPKWRKGV
jgi:hypothetical protein